MKLEKLLCLKYFGSRSRANSGGLHTTKVVLSSPHDTTRSVLGSSTSWYVFVRNGAGTDNFGKSRDSSSSSQELSAIKAMVRRPLACPVWWRRRRRSRKSWKKRERKERLSCSLNVCVCVCKSDEGFVFIMGSNMIIWYETPFFHFTIILNSNYIYIKEKLTFKG